jgi:hypothetical protein
MTWLGLGAINTAWLLWSRLRLRTKVCALQLKLRETDRMMHA